MIIGLGVFGYDNVNDTPLCTNQIYQVQLSNSVVDEVEVRGNTNIPYNNEKDVWQYDGIMLARFNSNLSAGNIDNDGVPIENLLLRRRKDNTLIWEDVISIPFDSSQHTYKYIDRYVQANQNYDIALVPVGYGNMQGNYITATITPEFEGCFVLDNNNTIHLIYNMSYDGIVYNQAIGKYEVLGSSYPVISFGSLNYRSSRVTATVISDNTLNGLGKDSNGIDLEQERLNLDNIVGFLNNRSAKILKDATGRYYCVITTNASEVPNNNFGQAINQVEFDWIEIAKPNDYSSTGLGNIINT